MRKTAAHETLALVSRPTSALPVGEQQTTNVRGAGNTRNTEVGGIAIQTNERTDQQGKKQDAQLQTQESNGVLCSNRNANDGCAESLNTGSPSGGADCFLLSLSDIPQFPPLR